MRALNSWQTFAWLCAMAYAGQAAAHDLPLSEASSTWTFDSWIVVPLLVSGLMFGIGWRRLRSRSRAPSERWRARALLFAAGWTAVALALISPLHSAGEKSFAAHMFEHELLMLCGAPLLVMAGPLVVMLWSLPAPWRVLMGRLFRSHGVLATLWARATGPFVATVLQAAALWVWHAPALFDLALSRRGWHMVQHASFLGSALLFWTAMLRQTPQSHRGVSALCLFVTSLVSGALGALMAFSQSPWYEGYARMPMAPFGLTPVEDQQLAGLLMWIPGGLVHALVALILIRSILTNTSLPRAADAT